MKKPLIPHSAIQTHCIESVMCNMSPVGSAEREREQLANGFTFEASAVILVCVQEVLCVMLGQLRERESLEKSHSEDRVTLSGQVLDFGIILVSDLTR